VSSFIQTFYRFVSSNGKFSSHISYKYQQNESILKNIWNYKQNIKMASKQINSVKFYRGGSSQVPIRNDNLGKE
jgi:hypothetical protein